MFPPVKSTQLCSGYCTKSGKTYKHNRRRAFPGVIEDSAADSFLRESLLGSSLARLKPRVYHGFMVKKLTEQECRAAIASGDFDSSIKASSPAAAIILTQSWCPQWAWMKRYIEDVAKEAGCDIYWIEYDREPFFDEFLGFKEETFGNDQVPYIRYYRNGALVHESNYIDRSGFLRFLKN